jgi:hypothetical protein
MKQYVLISAVESRLMARSIRVWNADGTTAPRSSAASTSSRSAAFVGLGDAAPKKIAAAGNRKLLLQGVKRGIGAVSRRG